MNNLAVSIREDIFESITDIFGINITDFTQIELGHMNLKWKLKTNLGDLFVKQYNKIRYPQHMLNGLEISLNHQDNLNKSGIPCPELFSHQGKYVLGTPSGEHFVLMKFCEGQIIKAGRANENQMYNLGQITGRMHRILNSSNTQKLPLHWDIRTKESMLENWEKRWHEANSLKCDKTISALEKQRKIIEKTDLKIFSQCEKGWGHWDLFVDNILFNPNSVSAILDFDRMHYVYPEFDLSRAVLSCALENGHIHLNRVSAFVEGYRENNELTREKFVRSIKLTWWKEAEWVRFEKEGDDSPLKRFREENIWVSENWDKLESLFAEL